ncbi:MAG: TetR/AcrR family transcriptional regulator [Deltaproteobacteria bacterium]|nr:TetR/AcrR family transcriptional regulator [Deltaproteobacteria bacterium]
MSPDARETRLLDAATKLFVRHGFDKTTIAEIAREAGVGKGSVYLHFDSKEDLLESLMLRDLYALSEGWFSAVMADPRGGTLGGMYKAMLEGLQRSPFMAALMGRDALLLGDYVRRPDNVFKLAGRGQMTRHEVIALMQQAGAVRDDIDAKVIAHIMNMLSYGMVGLDEIVPAEEIPPLEDTLAGIAEVMDRALTPPTEQASAAGKAVLEQVFSGARMKFRTLMDERRAKRESNQ